MSDNENTVDVLVVGAGFAGLYLLHRLRGMGFSVQVLEAGSGVGGTWYWNRYPGARCDVESMQYSYQFDDGLQQDWEWSERYAAQPEILRYAEHVADRFDLRRDIRFETRVASARFDEAAGAWELEAKDGSRFRGRHCILATGCLSRPNWPQIKGLSDFAGPVYHTAMWPHEKVDFSGKRVGVIGTGSSAIQSLPIIAREASHVTVFQRTANYSIPARNGPIDRKRMAEIKARYPAFREEARRTPTGINAVYNSASVFDATEADREAAFRERWEHGGLVFMGAFGDLMLSSEANRIAADFVRDRIREIVNDPETAEALCPTNIIGGKRICVDTDYFATYNRDNVDLVNLRKSPIERIAADAVCLEDGRRVEIDALVIATGFDAMTGAIKAIDIQGVDGRSLRDCWQEGPSSYLGIAMAGFPNLFTVTGPGSPSVLTNMLPTIEQHVEWITDCIAYMRDHGYQRADVDRQAEADWWNHVQEAGAVGLKATTDSWYIGANVEGKPRVFMPYLGGFPQYCQKCDAIAAAGYTGFHFA